jgi:hypothetical protein
VEGINSRVENSTPEVAGTGRGNLEVSISVRRCRIQGARHKGEFQYYFSPCTLNLEPCTGTLLAFDL